MVILPKSKFRSSKSEMNEGEGVIIGQVLCIDRLFFFFFWRKCIDRLKSGFF